MAKHIKHMTPSRPPKILYLHGLDSALSPEKRAVLERYFAVVSPQLDYRNTPDMFVRLSALVAVEKPDAIIGSSMGGRFAYYLAAKYALPALCFNPALGYRPFEIDLPEVGTAHNPIVFVLGGKDAVVSATENFAWIRANSHPNFVLKWYNTMGHRIDIETFTIEIEAFGKYLNHGQE